MINIKFLLTFIIAQCIVKLEEHLIQTFPHERSGEYESNDLSVP